MTISKLVFAPPSVCFETNTFNVFFTNTNKTFWQIRHLMVISKVVFASPSVCSGSQRGAAPRAGRGCLRQLGYCSSQTNSLNTFWQIQVFLRQIHLIIFDKYSEYFFRYANNTIFEPPAQWVEHCYSKQLRSCSSQIVCCSKKLLLWPDKKRESYFLFGHFIVFWYYGFHLVYFNSWTSWDWGFLNSFQKLSPHRQQVL